MVEEGVGVTVGFVTVGVGVGLQDCVGETVELDEVGDRGDVGDLDGGEGDLDGGSVGEHTACVLTVQFETSLPRAQFLQGTHEDEVVPPLLLKMVCVKK